MNLTETKALGERDVRVEFLGDAGATVARAHAEPILVVVIRTLLTLGARRRHAASRVLDKVARETWYCTQFNNTGNNSRMGLRNTCIPQK